MQTFTDRMTVATEHETRVLHALRAREWTADHFGQGQLSETIRARLRATETPLRWLPDIIAAKAFGARTVVVFVDAKGGESYRKSGRHNIERAALDAAERWVEFTGSASPLYYVFASGRVITPGMVRATAVPGRHRGVGSGTDFVTLPVDACWPFDAVFGCPQ